MSVRNLLSVAVAVLLGLFATAPAPLPLPSLGLLLAALTVLSAPECSGCLGLPGSVSPIGRRGP